MKIFEKDMRMVIQGDVAFTRVDDLEEKEFTTLKPEQGQLVVAHSETGHHHAFLENDDVEVLEDPDNEFVAWLRVTADSALKHYRAYDNHETIKFTPGIYRINRQREYTPEGFRRVAD
jgi:gentisate 1,2-dioxygenase